MRTILISNDDGIKSKGIWELKRFFEKDYKVFIVAPDRERSAAGHSISLHNPIQLQEIEIESVYAIDGTPVDAIHMAFLGLIPKPVDLVITGINNGLNLGSDVFYSGTVSAAFQAVAHGIPAVAVSIDNSDGDIHYETAVYYTGKIVKKLIDGGIANKVILNINVPNIPVDDVKGIEITKLGSRDYNDVLVEREGPDEKKYYSIEGELSGDILEKDTDVKAVHEQKVSITPLHWDVTAHHYITELRNRGFHTLT
ncbi:MAG: 5'/3'-nucleotidase SurE [Spirochaetota bacterium]|nr:MAG: 5'/3'-nucleotidase SurE [Spirochaetota bacterium]